jgi:cobalamin biosynthesis Mg chelatase CobN
VRRRGGLLLSLSLLGVLGACDQAADETKVRAEGPATTAEVQPGTSTSTSTSMSTSTTTSATTTTAPRPTTTRAAIAPTTTRTTPPTVGPASPKSGCDPNYAGACVPVDPVDVDCGGGSGNGPSFVYAKNFQVVGRDVYGLDADGDGIACEGR